jgi:hypothetical protein
MKLLILLLLPLFITQTLIAQDIKNEVFQLYKEKKFEKACTLAHRNYRRFLKDESYLSLYGFSCLNADYIDRLSAPSTLLKKKSTISCKCSLFFSHHSPKKTALPCNLGWI